MSLINDVVKKSKINAEAASGSAKIYLNDNSRSSVIAKVFYIMLLAVIVSGITMWAMHSKNSSSIRRYSQTAKLEDTSGVRNQFATRDSERQYQDAIKQINTENYKQAANILKNILQQEPGNQQASDALHRLQNSFAEFKK